MAEIRFGTDGWRDIIAENYTFENVTRVAEAYAGYLTDTGGKRVVVGHDTRFLAPKFAERAAEVLAASGLEVFLSKSYTPTPVLSFAVVHHQADGGVMITASHNPPEYCGFKLKGRYGGSATPDMVAEVEKRLSRAPKSFGASKHKIQRFDVRKPYYDQLMTVLDVEALKNYQGIMYHDSMGGAGAGYIAGFAKHARLGLELRELHNVPNPMFYGVNPEPIPQNLATIMAVLTVEAGSTFAAVTDGDADRIGAVLAGGKNFNSHQIFAVLMKHLVSKGQRGRVVMTFSVSRVVELLAAKLGLEVLTTPVGFKYVTDEFLKGGVLIGGEESGGIGIIGHLPERDGILNGLLLLESVVKSGKSLGAQFAEIEEMIGFKHNFDRLDLRLPSMRFSDEVMEKAKNPVKIGGQTVTKVETLDGVKWHFGDNGWILFRASGTEPVLRIYCEAQEEGIVKKVLAEAKKLVGV